MAHQRQWKMGRKQQPSSSGSGSGSGYHQQHQQQHHQHQHQQQEQDPLSSFLDSSSNSNIIGIHSTSGSPHPSAASPGGGNNNAYTSTNNSNDNSNARPHNHNYRPASQPPAPTADTSFLQDEDGLTEIIEHAFDHSQNNKMMTQHQSSTSITMRRSWSRSSFGNGGGKGGNSCGRRSPSVGSLMSSSDMEEQGLLGDDPDYMDQYGHDDDNVYSDNNHNNNTNVQQEDDEELDGKDRQQHYNIMPQDFDAGASIFASFSGLGNSNHANSHSHNNTNMNHNHDMNSNMHHSSSVGTSHLRTRGRKRKNMMNMLSRVVLSNTKALRIVSLACIVLTLFLSLHNATKHLKHYGQKHRTGSVYHRDFHRGTSGSADVNVNGNADGTTYTFHNHNKEDNMDAARHYDTTYHNNKPRHQSKFQELRDKLLRKQKEDTYAIVERGPHVNIELPSAYNSNLHHLANVNDANDPIRDTDIPLFWHIPRAGGSTLREIVTQCFGLTIASGLGKVPHDLTVDAIQVVQVPIAGATPTNADNSANNSNSNNHTGTHTGVMMSTTANYINVDVYQLDGIAKANELGMAASGLVDVVSSSLVLEASSSLFTSNHRGRLFTMLRHPVERAVSTFHYVQDTVWRRNHNDLADITIEEYFKSGSGENNWVTRFLVGATHRELTPQDLLVAKEILRKKCIVGLLEEKAESFRRFEHLFGSAVADVGVGVGNTAGDGNGNANPSPNTNNNKWRVNSNDQEQCHEKLLHWAWPLKHSHEMVEEGSDVWNLILKQNEYDMELYTFAQALFKHQGTQLFQ
jgi:hypothetical protein